MAAATKWKSFIAEFVKSQFSRSKQTREALPQKRFADIRSLHGAGADEVFAQSTTSPWTQAVQVLQTASAGPIATGIALFAILLGGLRFALRRGRSQTRPCRDDLRIRYGFQRPRPQTGAL